MTARVDIWVGQEARGKRRGKRQVEREICKKRECIGGSMQVFNKVIRGGRRKAMCRRQEVG